jgi:hypothetical protein
MAALGLMVGQAERKHWSPFVGSLVDVAQSGDVEL